MRASRVRSIAGIWLSWLVMTSVGWLLGFMVAVLLSEMLVMPFLHEESNLIVGVCMGGVVSGLQMMGIRRWLRVEWGWIAGGMLIFGPAFILQVVFGAASLDMDAPAVRIVFWGIVVAVGLAGAILQSLALRRAVGRWRWWVAGAVLSWCVAAGTSGSVDFLLAGVLLGGTGGLVMGWLVTDATSGGEAAAAA